MGAICSWRLFSTKRDKVLADSKHRILTRTFPICLNGNEAACFASVPGGLKPRYATGWEHFKFLHKPISIVYPNKSLHQ